MADMSALYDYFSAASDEAAAGVIDRAGGPGGPAVAPAPVKRGWFGRTSSPPPLQDMGPAFDTVSAGGIDPVVMMGTLEELLTGRPYDEVINDPRSGHIVAIRDEGQLLVVALTDALSQALAAASPQRLADVAVPWAATEEFGGRPTRTTSQWCSTNCPAWPGGPRPKVNGSTAGCVSRLTPTSVDGLRRPRSHLASFAPVDAPGRPSTNPRRTTPRREMTADLAPVHAR